MGRSKRKPQMELEVIHSQISQQRDRRQPQKGGRKYRRTDFLVTALKNIHSSQHCSKCFSKDDECRIKIPQKECPEGNVQLI